MKKIIFVFALMLGASITTVFASHSPSNAKCIKQVYTVTYTINGETAKYYFTYAGNAVTFYNYNVNAGLGGTWTYVGAQTVDCSVYTIDLP